MNNDVGWNLLAKYIFGECTEDEEEKVRLWMDRDPKRIALLQQLRRALQNQEDPTSSERWDTDTLWERVRERTKPEEAEASSSPSPLPTSTPCKKRQHEARSRDRRRLQSGHRLSSKHVVWGGAVVLLLVITVVGTLWQRGIPTPGTRMASVQEADTFQTEKSERAIIRLADGTRVQLNVDSRLVVPTDFGQQTRTTELEGEAFFEVVTDSTRPFIVQSGEVTTRVLGTAFDVNAYPEDEETQVAVSEGKVSLRANADEGRDRKEGRASKGRVVLSKQQIARITNNGNQVIRQDFDMRDHLAWMDGELVLNKAPFRRVVQKLERWYDLEISLELRKRGTPEGHLNARFSEDQDLAEVLEVVTTAFQTTYERHGQKVIIRPAQ